ncbi:type I DNA topoisomerase [Patescibacteria group bacterium]|nr:type I DNA topoisomerase [Patescibacteria group bacterium]
MDLVIVESPTKAKTLGGFLGKEYEVKASRGHIRDLPKSGLGVDVEHDFTPEYVVPEKSKKVLRELKKSAEGSQKIILATDLDREGEAIAWHLYELLQPKTKSKQKEFKRAVFHEITKGAIQESFDNLGELNMALVDAQQARRILDRLVGYKLSPLLWKKVRYGLSAGRVQSVAVRLIVERERERKAFKPEEYWSIKASFKDVENKRPFEAELVKIAGENEKIGNEKQANIIVEELKKDVFEVETIKKTEKKRSTNPPFKTSTLQQVMANVYGLSARSTMSAAQKLFEKGYITYHRTDSFNLSPQFVDSACNYIKKEFGADYLPEKALFYKSNSKGAQEAHEAIRPTDVRKTPLDKDRLKGDELKVYTMIWKRAVECQMVPAVYDQTTLEVLSEKKFLLRSTGSIIKFLGWMVVSKLLNFDINGEISELPEYNEGEKVKLNEVIPCQHFTQPPPRYNDASLIKKMEEIGVGRPSTYAPTISTITARRYVERDGRYFIPTDVAYVVVDLLVEHFPDIIGYEFTAEMESQLDEIAGGDKKWVPVVSEFYKPFEKELKSKEKELSKTDVTTLEVLDEKCPDCGKELVIKLGKYGKFISCSGYPDCEYARPMEEDKVYDDEGNEVTEFGKCPNCEDGKFVLKKGRFGKFLACSNYPKCKTTKPYLEKIGVKCPKCQENGKDGDVVIKKAKRKVFYGCSNYPECDWSSWTDPRGKTQDSE